MKNTLVSMVLFVSLAAACNKKADAPATAAKTETPAVAGSAAVAPAAAPAPAAAMPTPPAAAATTIASYDDYAKAGGEIIDSLAAAFKADGTNCDKLGEDVNKIVTDHAATLAAVKTYEDGHKDDKKKYDSDPAAKAQQKNFMDAATPAMKACKDNKALMGAFEKLGA